MNFTQTESEQIMKNVPVFARNAVHVVIEALEAVGWSIVDSDELDELRAEARKIKQPRSGW